MTEICKVCGAAPEDPCGRAKSISSIDFGTMSSDGTGQSLKETVTVSPDCTHKDEFKAAVDKAMKDSFPERRIEGPCGRIFCDGKTCTLLQFSQQFGVQITAVEIQSCQKPKELQEEIKSRKKH